MWKSDCLFRNKLECKSRWVDTLQFEHHWWILAVWQLLKLLVYALERFNVLRHNISVSKQVSKISLVDLAGSERADSTGAKGTRLKVGHFEFNRVWWNVSFQMSASIKCACFVPFLGRSQYQQIFNNTGQSYLCVGRDGKNSFNLNRNVLKRKVEIDKHLKNIFLYCFVGLCTKQGEDRFNLSLKINHYGCSFDNWHGVCSPYRTRRRRKLRALFHTEIQFWHGCWGKTLVRGFRHLAHTFLMIIIALHHIAVNIVHLTVVWSKNISEGQNVFHLSGGNSRTAMVAALSPADINYDETLSTLR